MDNKHGGEPAHDQALASQSSASDPQRDEVAQTFARDPFATMRDVMMDPQRFMTSFGGGGGRDLAAWNPSFEIRETDDAFVFRADLPGIAPDALEISLAGNELAVSAKREQRRNEQVEGRFHAHERSFGRFTRVFSLPESADRDHIRSDLKDGELTVIVPKLSGHRNSGRNQH